MRRVTVLLPLHLQLVLTFDILEFSSLLGAQQLQENIHHILI
jgi:hypothetical protein